MERELTVDAATMGLLIVDPYNDFISEGGKLWPYVRAVIERVDCVSHMRLLLQSARAAGIQIFYAPHRRWKPDDAGARKHAFPLQRAVENGKVFAHGTWGGTFRDEFTPGAGETVAAEHWGSSGFASTDLDLQLRKRGIRQVVVTGLRANTCIESTVRDAAELGYDVVVVRDAVASFSWDEMTAALEWNLPNYAAVVATETVVAALAASRSRASR